jgi:hypothetical protein
MRHKEPEFVLVWRQPVPKCCHTCEHYGVDGQCVVFFMEPPEEFADTRDACESWEIEVPF